MKLTNRLMLMLKKIEKVGRKRERKLEGISWKLCGSP